MPSVSAPTLGFFFAGQPVSSNATIATAHSAIDRSRTLFILTPPET
jgi:hypothetical protein